MSIGYSGMALGKNVSENSDLGRAIKGQMAGAEQE